MSTPDTLRWWADQIRRCTKEFYFSHVLVADLNYGADEIEKLQAENAKLRELAKRAQTVIEGNCALCVYFTGCTILQDGRCAAQTLFRQELREMEKGVDE